MARFLVPQPVAGFLIGTGGARTRQYSERSGAKVWVAGQQFVDVPGMRCALRRLLLVTAACLRDARAPGTRFDSLRLASNLACRAALESTDLEL